MIPYGRQDITNADVEAVLQIMRSEFLTQGPQVPLFEDALKSELGVKHAVAVNSATSALHIACLALDLCQGDLVWTTPVTFVASANCALYCGADIDFVDIDPKSYNIDTCALEQKLINSAKANRLPKILIAVHFAGRSCDMQVIANLSIKYGFKVIEDGSHAIGGSYMGERVGSCMYSDITVFSFHPVKIITTGEGGAAVTNDSAIARRLQLLRSHGITRDESSMVGSSEGDWYYQQIDLGFNYRMTDLQAALGCSQICRLTNYVERRNTLAIRYSELLSGLPLSTPIFTNQIKSSWHLYVVRLDVNKLRKNRAEIFTSLRGKGIGVNIHYIPVHLHPYYQKLGFRIGDFPMSEAFYSEALTIPLFPTMTTSDQNYIIQCMREELLPCD